MFFNLNFFKLSQFYFKTNKKTLVSFLFFFVYTHSNAYRKYELVTSFFEGLFEIKIFDDSKKIFDLLEFGFGG